MIKMALFDCSINEKCSPPRGIWQLKSPHPREFAIHGKKNANARASAREGGGGGALGAAGIEWYITFWKRKNFRLHLKNKI